MPIFEYICKDCKKRFEALVYGSRHPQCPLCQGANLEQQISVFSVGAGRSSRSEPVTSPCGGGMCGAGGACPYE
ncbi:MAG: zinc ribbon domain-containing protein [Terriglobales bacterium]